MADLFLVGTDGSACSKRAVTFAAERAQNAGTPLVLVAVVEWSRYAFYTPDELETRAKAKEDEIKRAQTQVLDPLVAQLGTDDISVSSLVRHGHAAEVLSTLAEEKGASQIFVGRHGQPTLGERLFGSVTSRLVQSASVPVTVVP